MIAIYASGQKFTGGLERKRNAPLNRGKPTARNYL